MLDLSFIGKDGLIIQYEDVISVMGFNIIHYMIKQNRCNEAMQRMSLEDILLSYLNRETYDIDKWIKDSFGIDFHYMDAKDSVQMVIPNFIYAYKLFQEAKKQKAVDLYIYSNEYYPGIEKMLPSFEVPELQYIHGDLIPILQDKPNATFITSNPSNIRTCLDIPTPFVLTIVDDFMYIKDIVAEKIDEELRKKGKFVFYTGILSGGLTNVGHVT
jgi:hypothetical protein